ncbi:hypothetical protein V5O48_002696 [Marasmius crinis-equi]|uniref:F-box domain-containing protein n=1 Tax=Marasmius crinis-equi TaxID=585013 RepID=A0ABR3FUX2_9AGAR
MDYPASLHLVGLDPFLSEDDARIVRQMLEKDEKSMATIDEEIAQMKAELAILTAQRNSALQRVTIRTGPSEADVQAIRANIIDGEQRLQSLEKEIEVARVHLDSLVDQEQLNPDTTSSVSSDLFSHASPTIPVEDSIRRYRDIVKDLENERDDILGNLARYNALLSPIRLLPLEVVAEIFHHCLPNQPFIRPSPFDAPILLTQVCRHWRDIALSTPSLWSSIAVTVHKDQCTPPLSLIETWVSRSKMQPLSFSIDERLHLEDVVEHEDLITGATVMEKFLPAYNRWKRASLTHADWRIEELGISDIRVDSGPPPLLEALYMSREYWLGNVHDPLRTLLAAPKLSTVHWRGVIAGHLNPAEIMPTESLAELKMDNLLTREHFHSILASGSNLVKCSFTVFFAGSEEATTPFTLPVLRELTIVADRADNRLFGILTTPALRELAIRRLDEPPSVFQLHTGRFWSQASFAAFLKRSACLLHTLDLAETDITPEELLEILQPLSGSLDSLSISNDHNDHCCVDDEVLRALDFTSPPSLCPRLDYLKMWGSMHTQDGLLANVLASRWEAQGEFRPLHMAMIKFSDDEQHPIDIARFQEMNEERKGITWIRSR